MAGITIAEDASSQRQHVLSVLELAAGEQITAGLEAAKSGNPLPERKALHTLCANALDAVPDGLSGTWESSTHKFWEGRRQRLKDAIRALGLVDPPAAGSKYGCIGTPLRANTPVRSGTPLCKPHAALTSANPPFPKPTPAKPPTAGTPTVPDSKKRKANPSIQPNKKNTTPRSRSSVPRDDELGTPKAEQPFKTASKEIKTSDWDASAIRCVMVAYQSRFDLSKDYVMPKSLPANLFKKPVKRR
ncbi:hypothetical protein DIPPA_65530 [Diplonema papillatum]|nr:hypothetical protein DIPPA_65530 [Diplonema papillatum]